MSNRACPIPFAVGVRVLDTEVTITESAVVLAAWTHLTGKRRAIEHLLDAASQVLAARGRGLNDVDLLEVEEEMLKTLLPIVRYAVKISL
jgi:hypothetical protein